MWKTIMNNILNKKRIIAFVVAILIISCGVILFPGQPSNPNEPVEIAKYALKLQYGWGNINKLDEFCTEDFIKSETYNVIQYGRKFYLSDGVPTVIQNDDEVIVIVNAYTPDMTRHVYHFIQTADGKYLIDDIECDI